MWALEGALEGLEMVVEDKAYIHNEEGASDEVLNSF